MHHDLRISVITARHGPMRVETSIGRDSGSRRGHEQLGLGLGLGFSGSRGRHEGQYFGRHGLKISIGYRLPPLDMGTCARRRRLGAILGRGAGTSN